MKKKYRVKCPSPQCGYAGMIDGQTDRPFTKPGSAASSKQRIGTGLERIQFRCPKCGTRWRERADRVR